MAGVELEVNATHYRAQRAGSADFEQHCHGTSRSIMSNTVKVDIHPSQFPEAVRLDLLESLRRGQLNHKFLYDSVRQTTKWLALHEAYSPACTDPDCEATYDRSFAAVADRISTQHVHLVGLGCGGGQKDSRLLRLLSQRECAITYTPSDVSLAMVLVAFKTAGAVLSRERCFPLVCDLSRAEELASDLEKREPQGAIRLVTFFGMLPNFEPELVLDRLARLIRPGDFLLTSANLAPGPDYDAGVNRILPLYDNELTRDWLFSFLQSLGVDPQDGKMKFGIETDPKNDLKRVVANFHFSRSRSIEVEGERFDFPEGDSIRLFFSYRHTPQKVRDLLARHGLTVDSEWITKSEEEGVFLVKPKSS